MSKLSETSSTMKNLSKSYLKNQINHKLDFKPFKNEQDIVGIKPSKVTNLKYTNLVFNLCDSMCKLNQFNRSYLILNKFIIKSI